MTVAQGMPDDLPEFDLAEIENYLAAQAPAATNPDSADPPPSPEPAVLERNGRTRRVRRLAGEVAEARHLAALQDSPVLVSAHTPRVLRTIRRGAEAVKLVQLRQNPAFAALAAVRARRVVTVTGLTALLIALGWSTAGVQSFAAGTAPRFSTQWWFAWGVEPFVSLALLTIVIARAFLASRGQTLAAPAVRRVEWLFLSATLLMNTWRHLPGVASPFRFDQLIIHMLGPIVAVCVVTVLPLLWVAIDNVSPRAPTTGPVESTQPDNATEDDIGNATSEVDQRAQERVAAALAKATALIRTGHLPPNPSANQVHKALGGAMDTARAVRDILRRGP
ncbi:conjugal transfer protein TraI [Actinophytocola sediminis]